MIIYVVGKVFGIFDVFLEEVEVELFGNLAIVVLGVLYLLIGGVVSVGDGNGFFVKI